SAAIRCWRWRGPGFTMTRIGCWRRMTGGRHGTGQEPVGGFDAIRISQSCTDQATRILEISDGTALLCQQHRLVPHGRGTLRTGDIIHWRVVVVPGPDAHHKVCGIANRQVIAEVLRRACLGRSRSYYAAIAFVAVLLRIGIELQDVAIEKLWCARGIVA